MSAMYTIGGACLGAGLLGAAEMDARWALLVLLGVALTVAAALVEKFNQ